MEIAELKPEADKISTDEVFKLVMQKEWRKIINCYQKKSLEPSIRITKSKETALHVAVSSLQSEKDTKLIIEMINCVTSNHLRLQNESGDTPLHLAATAGWKNICEKIVNTDKSLIKIRNNRGETPLFVAAHHGKHEAFRSLHKAYFDDENHEEADRDSFVSLVTRSEDGNTILHSTIARENFRLAYWIIQKYEKLSSRKNVNGDTPLHFLARKPNVFKSSSSMGPIDSIIYRCVLINKMKSSDCFPRSRDVNITTSTNNDLKYPPNYETCVNAFGLFKKLIKMCFPGKDSSAPKQTGSIEDEENQMIQGERKSHMDHIEVCPGEETKHEDLFPANYATCVFSFYVTIRIILTILGLGFWKIKEIKDKKQKNTHAKQVMKLLINSTSTYQYGYDGQDPDDQGIKYSSVPDLGLPPAPDADSTNVEMWDTPILIAAKNGISEMVKRIFSSVPISIHDTDSKDKSLLLVAAENRQTTVLRFLLQQKPPEYAFHRVDEDGNGILHLAAKLEKDFLPWKIPGAALQMQWELKWFQYVKKSFPALSVAHENTAGETPSKIFTATHKNLVNEGAEWLRKTSESCSVIAALIAGVAFATSASVPGGNDDQTGQPKLQGTTNFDIFSVASLVALCLSVTSLVCFLAIITSRFEESNFRTSLPMKLMLGLGGLFMSIAAMLVCFCAGHSFILANKMKIASLPIYMTVSVPLMIFIIAQLPLYVDLLRAALVNVPMRSYKVFSQ